MKKNIVVLMLGLMITTLAFSQHGKKKRHQSNPELKKEMQSYVEKNVVPVLQTAQDKFDAELSADDLAFVQAKRVEVAKKRAEKKANHEAHRAERKAMKEKVKNMTDEEREAFRKEKKEERKAKKGGEHRAEHKAMKAEMKEFMKRNKALIESTMTSLKPNYETWTTEQKAIFEKYKPADAPAMKEGKRKGRVGLFGLEMRRGKHHGKGKHGKHRGDKMKGEKGEKAGKRKGRKGGKLAVQFILWDGTAPTPPAERREDIGEKQMATPDAKISLGQNFPNPANGITRIEVEIPEGVNQLELTVTDMNGKVSKRLSLTNLNPGKESIELDVNDLPNGQYFYTVEADGFKASKKMTVNH
ncbi:MAG: T9SS type A sorting domain-containing protein [Saprospiraceae bacterium]